MASPKQYEFTITFPRMTDFQAEFVETALKRFLKVGLDSDGLKYELEVRSERPVYGIAAIADEDDV